MFHTSDIEQWNCLLKVQLKCQLRGKTWGWSAIFKNWVYILNQRSLYGAVSHVGKTWIWETNSGNMGDSISHYSQWAIEGVCATTPSTLDSIQLGYPKGYLATQIPLQRTQKAITATWTLCSLCHSGRQWSYHLTWVIDLDQEKKVELLSYNRGIWNPGDMLGYLVILPCSTVAMNRYMHQPQSQKGIITGA